MKPTLKLFLAGACVLATGCAESASGPQEEAIDLDAAFTSTPLGFSSTTSTFSSTSDAGGYRPHGPGSQHHGGPDFMGGGMHPDFLGGLPGGRPFDHPGPGAECSYSAGTGVVTCTSTREGLSVLRTYAFKTAAGTAQPRPDSTTHSVATHTEVNGTITRRDSVTAAVHHVSDRTVTGLEKGSTQRTVNGSSAGTESLSGKDSAGVAFTASRAVSDSTVGVVIPIQEGRPSYPTAGTIVRNMTVSVTRAGQTATRTRREVITFDGDNTATLVITVNGQTRTCTLPLPHGRPVCQ
jgi:hypothetical protein